MPTPTYVPGQVLDASDCNNWFTPDAGFYSGGGQTVTSSTFANVTGVSVTGLSSGTFSIFGTCYLTVNTSGGSAKFQWVTPDTLVVSAMFIGWLDVPTNSPPGGGPTSIGNTGFWNALGTNGQGSTLGAADRHIPFSGFFTATTGGGLALQAGITSGSMTVRQGTWFQVQRIN